MSCIILKRNDKKLYARLRANVKKNMNAKKKKTARQMQMARRFGEFRMLKRIIRETATR
jgi:hypothetical protein